MNKNLKILLILLPFCCICCFCLFFTTNLVGNSPTCTKQLNENLKVEFTFIANFENGKGLEVNYRYQNQELESLEYLNKSINIGNYISPILIRPDFCNEIPITKSGDVYLIGGSIIIHKDAKFNYNNFHLRQELNSLINNKLQSEYGELSLYSNLEDIVIEERNGRLFTNFIEVSQVSQIPDSYNLNYKPIGKVKFSIDYSKESSWKVEKIDFNK